MADESTHEASWYLCKENVEPLAKGRDVSKIEEASISSTTKNTSLNTMRASYEEKILLDEGDDPLQNWIEFIDWIEQSYPGGGKEGRLMDVLTDCVQRYIEDPRYTDSEKFYSIFAKYRRRLSDPLEKYDSLFAKKIFTKLASFYVDWSWLFESAGNFKEADNILDRGLLIGAEPKDDITTARTQLQTRLAKKITSGEVLEDPSVQRKALIGLKPRIKKDVAIAPIDRVSSIKTDSQGLATGPVKSSNSTPFIYVDEENMLPGEPVMPTGSVKSSVIADTKENAMKPGRWSDYRIRKKPVVKPQSEFVIYEEENEDSSLPSDSAADTTLSADVFKVRKRNEDSPVLVKLENLSGSKFYCDLDKMYIGGTEYSFEEIRYMKWLQAKKLKEDQKSRQEHMEALLQRIAELEAKISEREEKDKEREEIDKFREEELKLFASELKDKEQRERFREIKEKERELKDKERELKDSERDGKEKERDLKEKARIQTDIEMKEKEERRAQNESERLANESERIKQEKERQEGENERILAEKERVIHEKEREINEKERGIKIKEMDSAIQSLESKLSTLVKLLQDKKLEKLEMSIVQKEVLNVLNGTDDTLTLPIANCCKSTIPVKDFTIFKDEPTLTEATMKEPTAPLIRFDVSEPPTRSETTVKAADLDLTVQNQKLDKLDTKSDFDPIHRGSMHWRFSEAYTMMIPPSADECLPKSCSTPGK